MKKLFLLLTLFGVLAVGCENLLPNEQKPTKEAIFITDGEGAYILEAEGGEVVVTIATDVDYRIVIPEDAKSWISLGGTRAEARMETQTFIIAENDTIKNRLANIDFVDGKGKVLKSLLFTQKCSDKVFNCDSEGNYVVVAEGGEVNVAVTTNLEYSVAIPEDAQEWLSIADTRAEIREETLTFIVAENKESEERSASVELVDNAGVVLQTILFIQNAGSLNNKIYYTNGSTTEPTTPHATDVFGANIVSNTYDAETECWVIKFDGEVTTIGSGAFDGCSSLTSVTIPDSVTTIGVCAFVHCSSLTSVTIPDGVTTIENSAFEDCSSLTSVTIGDSVTTIGVCAFVLCSSLTSVTIGDSVTSIGECAFLFCENLVDITIPDSVTEIGGCVFAECYNLTSATIGDGVDAIGGCVFQNCINLVEISGKFASEDGRCLIIDGVLNSFAPAGLTEYTIPDSVTTIGEGAFYYCSSLTSVTIPDSVTTIGDHAFEDCSGLTGITIPDSVTTIGDYAFHGCSGLTGITIPDSVTTIGDHAFLLCGNLVDITIPDSVTEIGDYVFAECYNLTSATLEDGVDAIGVLVFRNCINLVEISGKFASEDGRCLIIDGVLNSFAPAGLTEYTIPDSVTTIGERAFAYCSNLTSVTIGDSVTTIGDYAFYGCSSLTSVFCKATTPPQGGYSMFDYTAPDCVIYVPVESQYDYISASYWGNYAIVGYDYESGEVIEPELTDFIMEYTSTDGGIVYPSNIEAFDATVVHNTYEDGVGRLYFDRPITEIGDWAFSYRNRLKSVSIPDSVITIGDYAFYHCEGLESVDLGNSVTSIGVMAFDGSISLREVTIPESVTSIGIQPFCYCTSLSSIKGKFASEDGMCLIVDGNLIAFAIGCDNVGDYVIPEGVNRIERYSVYYCHGLTSVTISEGVTSIGEGAFADCDGLASVTIPSSVTEIEGLSFNDCENLTNVYSLATTPPGAMMSYTGNWDAFAHNASGRMIFVPMESVEAYRYAYGWSEYASSIETEYTQTECTSLTITADDVVGNNMRTMVYYTAVTNGVSHCGEYISQTITGSAMSDEFPQNTSMTESVERTISFTYLGQTATTTITQGPWPSGIFPLSLND